MVQKPWIVVIISFSDNFSYKRYFFAMSGTFAELFCDCNASIYKVVCANVKFCANYLTKKLKQTSQALQHNILISLNNQILPNFLKMKINRDFEQGNKGIKREPSFFSRQLLQTPASSCKHALEAVGLYV